MFARFQISIHALREEGDRLPRGLGRVPDISIHALREEGDFQDRKEISARYLFLSTPSARRATVELAHQGARRLISIHALREEGDVYARHPESRPRISIHALREEGDAWCLIGSRL